MRFMLSLLRARWRLALFAFWAAVFTPAVFAQFTITRDRPNGVYGAGDTVTWTIAWAGTGSAPGASYTILRDTLTKVAEGNLQFTNGKTTLSRSFTAPSTLVLKVSWTASGSTQNAYSGAVGSPEEITTAAPPPADFDTFWNAKIAQIKAINPNAQLESVSSDRSGVAYWKVTMDNVGGAKIRGQIAKPDRTGKFPAMLIVQWGGVYGLQKSWVTAPAVDGWLALDIEAHDILIDQPDSYYNNLFQGPLANYWNIGNDDRETSYYLKMYLAGYQAIEYLKSRSDWDGRTLVITGVSQGGQQAFVLGGLQAASVTGVCVLVPAACDLRGPDIGRQSGFPFWYSNTSGKDPEKVRQTSLYFDPVNFTRRINCPTLIGLGLQDDTATPASIFAAAREITSDKEIVVLPNSGHHEENGSQDAYEARQASWFAAMRDGKATSSFVTAPTLHTQPVAASATSGTNVTLKVGALNARTFQWKKNGVVIPGATSATLTISGAQASDAGNYSVVVGNAGGTVESDAVPVSVAGGTSARLINLSTRAFVGTGERILIAGFVIGGNGSKKVLLRAAGPALSIFNVAGVLANPQITLTTQKNDFIASNDDWGQGNNLAEITAANQATGFTFPTGGKDSALIATLPAGPYTLQVSGVGSTTGVALVEVYDLEPSTGTRLINLSTRAQVGTASETMIAGFVLSGGDSRKLLVRAIGPGLAPFGVSQYVTDPALQLTTTSGALLTENNDWSSSLQSNEIITVGAQTGAFPLSNPSKDAALVTTRAAGPYTALVTGTGTTNGIALVEVYEAP